MVIDTSAIVAMLMNEASANRLVGEDQVVLARDEPLLFVGDEFAKTDVAVAEW